MRHYFLGLASGKTRSERQSQLFAYGKEADYYALQNYILKEYGAHQVLITRNGRSAIAAGLKSYFEDGGEVIINGFTCHAVVQGVKAAGMTPVFADIDRGTLNFTVKTIEAVMTKKTRAIIIQNTLGNMVEMKKIEAFAKKNGLVIIEDLAHCTGRHYEDGREAGTVGKITVFSFGKEKSIDVGNGGAVAFRDSVAPMVNVPKLRPPVSEVLRARWYPTFGAMYRGLSYVKLNGLFMRMLLSLKWVKKSADGEVEFDKHLSYAQAKLALEQLKRREKIGKKPLREFYLVENRDEVMKELEKAGYYFSGFWYEKPVSPERYYKRADFPEKKCPEAVYVSEHIINFPNYYSKKELEPAKKIVMKYLEGKK